MEGGVPPPLITPSNDTKCIFTQSLPSTSRHLHPHLLHQSTEEPDQDGSDIDWVSLFSGSIKCDDQKLSSPSVSQTAKSRDEEENGGQDKGRARRSKKVVPPRIAFHTRSADDILDDGYRWRKYGQKSVKNSIYPRSYYHCTHHTCKVKKQIQRLSKDPSIVVTTYEGIHNHPCEKVMESLSPLLNQIHFLTRF